MMNEILRAGGGEGFFWTIMIIIWIISKATAASRNAKRQGKAVPPPHAPVQRSAVKPKLPPAELQSFLDSLTGARSQPKPAAAAPRQHRPMVRPQKAAEPVRAPDAWTPAHVAPAVAAVQMTQQMSLLNTSVRDLITDIPSARMPNLSMGFYAPQTGAVQVDKPDLRNKSELRKAMLGHLILTRPPSAGW